MHLALCFREADPTFLLSQTFLVNAYDALNFLVGQLLGPFDSLSERLLPNIMQGTALGIWFVWTIH